MFLKILTAIFKEIKLAFESENIVDPRAIV